MGLRPVLQSYPRRKPYMRFLYVRPEVCPRVSMFPESGFLQIPPHDGHPCLRLCPSHHRADSGDSGLSPVRNVRRRAHQKSANGLPIPFADLYFSLYTNAALLIYVFQPLILPFLLTQDCRIGGCVICFYHVNGESIILARISQTVRDVRFGLPVSADIFHIQVQNIIILFEQRLIGGT